MFYYLLYQNIDNKCLVFSFKRYKTLGEAEIAKKEKEASSHLNYFILKSLGEVVQDYAPDKED